MSFEKLSFQNPEERKAEIVKTDTGSYLDGLAQLNQESVVPPAHKKYHEHEDTSYGRLSKSNIEELKYMEYDLVQDSLNPEDERDPGWEKWRREAKNAEPSPISPEAPPDPVFERWKNLEKDYWKLNGFTERDFFLSLNNKAEKKLRMEIRENLINLLESIYDSLNWPISDIGSPLPEIAQSRRSLELKRVLAEKGIEPKDKEIKEILDLIHHPYGFKNKFINNKEDFIENALLRFEPFVFKEAKDKIQEKSQ